LKTSIKERYTEIEKLEKQFSVLKKNLIKASENEIRYFINQQVLITCSRIMVEMNSGGNIRLEVGSPSEVWYASCVELVQSHFDIADYKAYLHVDDALLLT
jgi:hypothetical protein